jgi:hypothetical protein
MTTVKFGRGEPICVGNGWVPTNRKAYHSKCGRFRIESRMYNLPTLSIGYTVYVMRDGEWKRTGRPGHDSLADAKEAANDMAERGEVG